MPPQMDLECLVTKEVFATILALVFVIRWMLGDLVRPHLRLGLKGQEADGTGGCGLDALMDRLDVVDHGNPLRESLSTPVTIVVQHRLGLSLTDALCPEVHLQVPIVVDRLGKCLAASGANTVLTVRLEYALLIVRLCLRKGILVFKVPTILW